MAKHSSGRRLDTGAANSGIGKVAAPSSRLSNSEASSSRKMTSSSSSTRKSERLEKRMPQTPPLATRKSQRLEEQNTPSPLRRSERCKTHTSSTSSGSRSSEKVSSSLGRQKNKEQKEKSVKQLTMESDKVIIGENHDQGSFISLKRKRMDGHSYKALFKKQKRRYSAPDSHEKLERQGTLPRIDSINSGASGYKLLEDQENGVHECGQSLAEGLREGSLGRGNGNENHGFVGNCTECSKRRRLDYGLPEERLCSCGETMNWTSRDTSTHKVSGNVEDDFNSESVGERKCTTQSNETLSGTEIGSLKNICIICKKGGKLLCCVGQNCSRYYHLSCLDSSLDDDLPGVWHCSLCVRKKVEFGVHTVSKGVESIWDVREVMEKDMKETHRQKQYLVKYQGLAHVHNHWVPEKQLLQEFPSIVAKFSQEHKNVRWNPEWRLPHRLLRKRRLMSCSQQDKNRSLNIDVVPDCQFEWLVKWRGLDYHHITWEINNTDLQCSPEGQKLMRDYENRRQKAKKVSDKSSENDPVKLPKLPGEGSHVTDDNLLMNVNKLREFWHKNQSAVIFDEQDRLVNVILFILSLTEYHQPFLIVTTPNALPLWEAEFMRLAPSVDVVVYSGNWDTRRSIRTLEFYDQGGNIILQVLLSTLENVIEDVQTLKGIKWEAVIVDECQSSDVNANVEFIKMLPMHMRLLLFSGQLKDVAEYQSLLSLLGSYGDKVCGLRLNPNDNLVKLKENLSQFIAYGSKFVEYWVPVPMSNLQLEQYCATLLKNTIALWSSSKRDSVGALHDILMTLRKCCVHPYIVDSSLLTSTTKGLQGLEAMSVGIKASGRLQLLDMILLKIRRQKLRALILFQSIAGPGEISNGDILDDFLRLRFGKDSYERIDSHLAQQKKQAAMDRFNSKEGEQFVFLLENRACLPSIKLSIDFVVIFDSDCNPVNDIKVLQKISIDSQHEQVKVFRLYSSYTLEEKLLILSKHHANLNVQNTSRATSDTLLMWGASYLFSRLDNYHAEKSSVDSSDISSGQEWLLDDVLKDFLAILLDNCKNNNGHVSVISQASRSVGVYHTDGLLLGERELQVPDEERQTFWKKLLEGRNPRWKFLLGPTPRSRKRVQYAENDEEENKRRKVVSTCNIESSFQLELEGRGQAGGSGAEVSAFAATNQSQLSPMPVACSLDNAKKATDILSQETFLHESDPERTTPSNEQKSLHTFLREEMAKLCQILKLSKDVVNMVGEFLEYVLENHHVNKESISILQAFQMSLCWIAASILKEKIDRIESLTLAKQALDFQCTEEEADSVYRKLRLLKRAFLQLPANSDSILSNNTVSASEGLIDKSVNAGETPSTSFNLQNVKLEVEERPLNLEPSWEHAVDELNSNHMVRKIKKIQKKCNKHMSKLRIKQDEEIQEFQKMWEQKRAQLEGEHQLELAFIRTTYSQSAMRMDKLKMSDSEFEKVIHEHERLMKVQLKELEAKHAAIREEESKRIADWLAKKKSRICQFRDADELHIHGSESNYEVGFSGGSGHITSQGLENEVPSSGPGVGEESPDRIVHVTRGSDVIMSNISVTAPDGIFSCTVHSKTSPTPVIAFSDEALGVVPMVASSVSGIEQFKQLSQTSTISPKTNSQAAVDCSVPAERSPVMLNPISEELVIVPVEPSSAARVERPNEACSLPHMAQQITSNCSFHGMEGNVYIDMATSKVQDAHETSLSGQNSKIPSGVCCSSVGSEIRNSFTGVQLNAGNGRGNSVGSDIMGNLRGGTDGICETAAPSQQQSADQVSLPTIPSELPQQCVLEDDCLANVDSVDKQVNDASVSGNEITLVGFASCKGFNAGSSLKSNCEVQVAENCEQLQPASDCAPLVCNQPTAVEVVRRGHGEGSLQTSEFSALELCHPAGNLVQPTSSPPACSQPPAADVFNQCHNEGNSSLHTSEGFPQLVEGSVNVSDQTAAQNEEIFVQPASDCLSSVCRQTIAAEPIHEGHIEVINSPQSFEVPDQVAEGSFELSCRTVSQNGDNLVLPPSTEGIDSVQCQNHFDLQMVRSDYEPNGGQSAVCQNTVASSQAVENAAELPNQAPHQLGNLAIPEGPNHLLMQQLRPSWIPTQPLHTEPLQNELERIRKETEQTIMLHDSTKLQLKSECEKEIEEMIAQIRGKYEAKLKDAESAFLLRKDELDSNHKKVLMNKILAEAFRSKCLDLRRSSAMQQASSSSLVQHMHQLSLQPALRNSSVATLSSAIQPAVSQQIAIPPIHSLHRSPGLFPSGPARPPQINAITPFLVGPRVGGEIRAPAPHLQPFRPSTGTSVASISRVPCNVPSQQLPSNFPATSGSLSSIATQQPFPLTSQFSAQRNSPTSSPPQSQPQHQALDAQPPSRSTRPSQPGRHNSTISAVELLMDIDNQAGGHLPNILQHLAGSGLNTNALDPSVTRESGNVNGGSRATPAIASDVVCLSDDEN